MEIRFTALAETDLAEISQYLLSHFPAKAETTYRAIMKNCELLSQYPQMGRLNDITNARELKVASLPYYIIYREMAGALVVLRVYHTSRNPLVT